MRVRPASRVPVFRQPRATLFFVGGVGAVVLGFAVAITAGVIDLTPGEEPGLLSQPTSTGSAMASPIPTAANGTPGPIVTPTPAPTRTPAPRAQTPAATPLATSTPAPEPARPVTVDELAVSRVNRLTVRAAPGRSAERLGTIMAEWEAYVADGPVYADGLPWYLISGLGLPPNAGCEWPYLTDPFNCPGWIGWAAGASAEGEPWLVGAEPRCPGPGDYRAVASLQPLVRLACFRETSLEFAAWWPGPTEGAGCHLDAGPDIEWLLCPSVSGVALAPSPAEIGLNVLTVAVDPRSGVVMPSDSTWVRIAGHLGDPSAATCALVSPDPLTSEMRGDDVARQAQALHCRATFVADSVVATGGP